MALPKIDPAVIEAARDRIVDVIAPYIDGGLSSRGRELWGRCPFHDESSASFRVTDDAKHRNWRCFGCNERGDAIDFIMKIEQIDMPAAIRRITGNPTFEVADLPPRERKAPPPPKWTPAPFAPEEADTIKHPQLGKPDVVYTYRDSDEQLIGYVCRFNFDDGRKEVLPYTWATNNENGREGWRWMGFVKPRPIYGLDLLAERPSAPVIIVEGEKAANAAGNLCPWAVAVSWPGGGGGVSLVDWSPLEGRKVLLWRDADAAGHKAMFGYTDDKDVYHAGIADLIGPFAASRSALTIPPTMPKGWDAADAEAEGWTVEQTRAFITAQAVKLAEPHEDDGTEPEAPPAAAERQTDEQIAAELMQSTYEPLPDLDEDGGGSEPEDLRDDGGAPFRVLGYYRDEFYFLGFRSKQIRSFTSRGLSENALMELAPLQWWQANFAGARGGLETKSAVNWIIDAAYRRGVYDPRHVRGRGAWRDNGRVVYHFGDALHVDGVPTDVLNINSKYIYQLERRLTRPADLPLTDDEANEVLDTARIFGWNKPASAALVAGWIALAPICGALRWRPHIWLTGNAGCGKSTILEEFMGYLLGPLPLRVQGASTEAGIRQTLGTDAIPVLFDETEQNDKREQQRMQAVLTMIRQASTESGMQTLRGTVSGDAVTYHIRSMFALASIQVGIRHQADFERLSVLSLRSAKDGSMRPEEAAQTWADAKRAIGALHADRTLPMRFFRRVLDLAPITLRNVETFTRAAAVHFGNQRDGDQYGTLLAGAWSLQSSALATDEDARALIEAYDWSEIHELAEGDQSRKALAALLGCLLQDDQGNRVTIGEAISRSPRGQFWSDQDETNAFANLIARYGLRITGDRLFITHENHNRARLLEHTPYAADLAGLLKRLPGAQTGRDVKPLRFPGQGTARGFTVPLALLE